LYLNQSISSLLPSKLPVNVVVFGSIIVASKLLSLTLSIVILISLVTILPAISVVF